jgi:hypothetical protein
MARKSSRREEEIPEIAVVGDLSESESSVVDKLLEVPEGGRCTLYFDCPGGGAYTAISLLTLMTVRRLNATGIVTGECSSAALWPLAVQRAALPPVEMAERREYRLGRSPRMGPAF